MVKKFFWENKVIILFFVLYFSVGLFLLRDFGASWDELYQDGIGQINMQYVTRMNKQLLDNRNPARFVSPLYEMFVVGTGRALDVRSEGFAITGQTSMYHRHFLNFCTFFIGVIFFYFLCRHRFKNKYIGLLGATMLILTPRLLADAYYNSKDTVFLVFFVVTFYALIKFLEKRNIIRLTLLAVLTGMTFSIRVGIVFIPFFVVMCFAADYIFMGNFKKRYKKDIVQLLFYATLSAGVIFFTYPVLWSNPIHNFLYLLQFFGHFPNIVPNLYFGRYVPSNNIPWHFIPVWISITTPPVYIMLFITGFLGLVLSLKKSVKHFYLTRREDVLILLWFFFPLLAVIVFRSSLYNSWRHMFFIYPAFIMIAIHGVLYIKDIVYGNFRHTIIPRLVCILLLINFAYVVKVMVDLHPYEHLYFNFLAGPDMKTIRKNFDTDYWGLTYLEGLEFILRYDKSKNTIYVIGDFPAYDNYFILSESDSHRIFVGMPWDVGPPIPRYFMTNFFFSQKEFPYKEIYAVNVKGADILKVYELPASANIRFDGKFIYR